MTNGNAGQAALVETIRAALVGAKPEDAIAKLSRLLSNSAIDVPSRPQLGDLDALPNGAAVTALLSELAVGSGPDGSTTGTGPRMTWTNQLANQKAQPLQLASATSLMAAGDPTSLVSLLAAAASSGSLARALGSGHSYSDVATSPDWLIDTHGLSRLSDPSTPIAGQLSAAMLRSKLQLAVEPVTFSAYDPEANRALIEMEAGVTIRALNPQLDARGVGLMNMGGYDGQTIAGVISTSTHGSGIAIGPFSDMVQSLVLATTSPYPGATKGGASGSGNPHVFLYRIEPTAGITNPATYDDPNIALLQDDDTFRAVICGMGCFGVIYSVVLEVMQQYWLTETRSLLTLAQLLPQLAPTSDGGLPPLLANNRHVEALIQPYPISIGSGVVTMDPQKMRSYDGDFLCLLTVRNIAPKPATPPKPRPTMADWVAKLLSVALHIEPTLTPYALDVSIATLVDQSYVNASYAIFDLGLAGDVGIATEIGFSVDTPSGAYTDANFLAAIDTIHLTAQRARLSGAQYQTSPFSLRFVAASNAHLSMMQGRRTAMIELDLLTGTLGTEEILYRYQESVRALGARPHWGLEFDVLTGGPLESLYPELSKWLTAYRALNATGTFRNRFTTRMGFDLAP